MFGLRISLAALAACLMFAVSGCADSAMAVRKFVRDPFEKSAEEVHGIQTPKDRVKELRQLASGAKKLSPDEQQRVVANLTKAVHGESDPWVRREMLKTLAAYPQVEAEAALVEALSDSDIETRRVACSGLSRRGSPTSQHELARVLASDTSVDVRMAAAKALGESGDKAALGPLAEALADPDPAFQVEVQQSLMALSGRDFGNNVPAWREFAQTGKSDAPQVSIAEKFRRTFY